MSGRLLVTRRTASFHGAMLVSVSSAETALPPAAVAGVTVSADSDTA